ncbi:MAG: PEP-CTERM sorting domain-containing protein [Planctomycetaceae bacterium]
MGTDPPPQAPEPTTFLLVVIGAGGLALQRTRRRVAATLLSGVARPEEG